MTLILGENFPQSSYVRVWAEETREVARGYRDMRNILGVGIAGVTSAMNATESVSSMSSVDQLKFNLVGIATAAVSALGMEYGRRKLERHAKRFDANAEELASLDL